MKKTLLVVDDSIFIFEEMKHILKDSEFEIVGYAKCGEEAFSLYEQKRPDVVTMDIILPGMDGIKAAHALLNQWPEAKVIVVSSLAYSETVEESKEVGASGFVFKPFEPDQLLSALRKAVSDEAC